MIAEFAAETPKVRRLLANVPTLMIFDDHEVTDDWNLNLDWVKLVNDSAAGPQLLQNALVAYAVFQDWGNQPKHYQTDGAAGDRILKAATVVGDDPPPLFDSVTGIGTKDLHKVLAIGEAANTKAGPPEPNSDQKRWDFVYEPVPDSPYRVVILDTRTRRQFVSDGAVAALLSWMKTALTSVSDPNPQVGEIAAARLLSDAAMKDQVEDALAGAPNGRVHFVVSPAPVFGLPLLEDSVQKVMANYQDPGGIRLRGVVLRRGQLRQAHAEPAGARRHPALGRRPLRVLQRHPLRIRGGSGCQRRPGDPAVFQFSEERNCHDAQPGDVRVPHDAPGS